MRVASIKPNELALVDGEELVLIGDLLAQKGLLSQRSSMMDFIDAPAFMALGLYREESAGEQ